ncbi:MAG: 23S rRNA (uracil(1939)-C(5))-methyltransferase RlmD [Acidobacteriaceae bacterium]
MKLKIEKSIYGGAGLAHISADDTASAGKAVFVPATLPGEVVEAEIAEEKRTFATAELVRVLEPSPDRVAPPCPYFSRCGGCQYQHATYAAQLAMKSAILRESLERAKLRDLPEIVVHGAETEAQAWQYRNRIRLHVAHAAHGLALGYKERGSHAVLPIDACMIAAPLLGQAATALLSQSENSQEAYALLSGCAEMELFCNAEEAAVQISLYLQSDDRSLTAGFKEICDAWKEQVPQLAGVGLYAPQASAGKRDEPVMRQLANWGGNTLHYTADGSKYRVSRGAFFQVNRYRVDELVQLVTQGRSGAAAWDLYAGAGLFSCALAKNFEQVIAVEVASPANKDLAQNLAQAAHATAHKVVAVTTQEFLEGQARSRKGKTPQLIVLDPPRAGLGAEVCRLLAKIAAPELVYVSCDPATLSRDLASLVESGYQLQQLHLVDLFPQSFHLETVVMLTRA